MKKLFPVLSLLVPASLVIGSLAPTVHGGGTAHAAEDAQPMYDKLCKSCHGVDGKGVATKAAVLKIDANLLNFNRDEAKALSKDEKKKILLGGKDKMPAYEKKVTPEQADSLLDLVAKLQGTT